MTDNSDKSLDLQRFERRVRESINELKDIVDRNFPGLFSVLKMCLSVKLVMSIDEITLPVMLILLGPPASGKTTVITMMESLPDIYKTDSFTPASIVTAYAGKTKGELDKIHLISLIDGKTFLTSELAPLFSVREDVLVTNIGILTRLLDGQGYLRNTGVHQQLGSDSCFFTWIGAMVDVPKNIWPLIGRLGAKQFFLRLTIETSYKKEQEQILKNIHGKSYKVRLEEITSKLQECWKLIREFPGQKDGKIVWNDLKDDQESMLMIIQFAQLLARLRGKIPTDGTRNTSGTNYAFLEPIIESAERSFHSLYNIARGNALLHGRNYIIKEDVRGVESIVLSSASKERIELLKSLKENNGELTTTQFMQKRKVTRSTALRAMKMLEMLGIVNEVKISGKTKDNIGIRLKVEFRWLLKNSLE